VLYHQRTRALETEERELNASYAPLTQLLTESDWIAPQVPTLPTTRNLLGRNELAQIKPGACIVNVANAPIINRDALIEALRSGRLGGVALDVHYQEPVPDDDEILSFDNVVLTPRMAGSPRFNGLNDFAELITGLARELKP
jgi:glyoxylate reductase